MRCLVKSLRAEFKKKSVCSMIHRPGSVVCLRLSISIFRSQRGGWSSEHALLFGCDSWMVVL